MKKLILIAAASFVLVQASNAQLFNFGIKGGIFTILTGGDFRVWGPPGSFIEGNNEIALAILIVISLLLTVVVIDLILFC